MATNLRLRSETEAALKAEAQRSHRSQQDVIRAALDQYLQISETSVPLPGARPAVTPARVPFRRVTPLLKLPEGVTSAQLMDREDRF